MGSSRVHFTGEDKMSGSKTIGAQNKLILPDQPYHDVSIIILKTSERPQPHPCGLLFMYFL